MRRNVDFTVLLAYAAFVLIGLSTGVSGVLLLSQMHDYGVDRAVIGITFFTGSGGFLLGSTTVGVLMSRFGTRAAVVAGGVLFLVAGLYTATRPSFVVFLAVQVVLGYGTGLLESVLNAHLAALPNATNRLNRLHAFFGVGALLGPLLATWVTGFASWPIVWLVLGLAALPLVVGFRMAYPSVARAAEPVVATGERGVLRRPAVLLGAALLAVYVGIEFSMGNWSFGYLVQERGQSEAISGYAVSGYWFGLTAGRFVLSPIVARLGLGTVGLMYTCLVGVAGSVGLTWLAPIAGLAVLGFFLGPIFPTTMAVTPQLVEPRMVPSAIGMLNAGSVVGGSLMPWLAGVVAQGVGVWTLLPFTLALALLQLAVWWPMARGLDGVPPKNPNPPTPLHDPKQHASPL
ncbi:MFS transporter [Allorhizocola rhizosphaerae]|uniref:MFS transporter n=1 Tax=Allorhizocola rhizosphaerae TaxID=1872709 RepID=UPI000E3BFDB9|nr:MFS transporter [Allorhizocola rhizosphaerae]